MHQIVVAEWGAREYQDYTSRFLCNAKDHGKDVAELVRQFEGFFPGSAVLPVNRGRVALALALSAFAARRPEKRQVVYPAYVCDSVIQTIERAGLVPKAADVGVDLNLGLAEVERAVTPDTLAVIVAHAYACPAQISEIEEFCRSRGVFLVDDAANVVGVTNHGRMLGGFGDVGLISFTASKSIVAGWHNAGGLLLVNNAELLDALRRAWRALPAPHYRLYDVMRCLRDTHFEPYFRQASYYYQAVRSRAFGGTQPGAYPAARMPNISAAVALRQLAGLPARIDGRIRVAELFHQYLAGVPAVSFPQYAPGRYLTRILIQVSAGVDREAVRQALRRGGVATRRGYDLDFRYGTDVLQIRHIAPRLVELPSHSRMGKAEVAAICTVLRQSTELSRLCTAA